MKNTFFQIDWLPLLLALLLAALFYFGWRRKERFAEPSVAFSKLKDLQTNNRGWRIFLGPLPKWLFVGALGLFFLAFLDPRFMVKIPKRPETGQQANPTEGIAIYFVLDHSGSMVEKIPSANGMIRKLDLLKEVTTEFIEGDPKLGLSGRPNDLIGLIAFARGAEILSPLTLDHQAILKQISQFKQVGDMNQDGTAIGYALFKAANLIAATRHYAQELGQKGEPAYQIKSNVIILVTDGLQDPNPLDKDKRLRNLEIPDAAQYIKEQGIRFYAIIIEPQLLTEEFAPYRHQMQRSTQLTGGNFYIIQNADDLSQIYAQIDKLEKSILPEEEAGQAMEKRPDLYQKTPLAPYLLAIALLCLFFSTLLNSTVLRRAP